jgi:hypothetical protein
VYYSKTYSGLDVVASQAADSCVATIYAIPVNWTGIYSDYTNWHRGTTIADSVNVTAAGLTRKTMSLPLGRYYMFIIETLYGNGKDANFVLSFSSDGHE